MAVADGLGHGSEAAYAADVAMACIGGGLERSFADHFSACDARLRDTRGAALAIAVVDLMQATLTMASVGNIRAVLMRPGKNFRLGGTRGIVGGGYERLVPETEHLARGDVLALFSDGVDEFAPMVETLTDGALSPREKASIVVKRWARPDDDAAVLVYRHHA
jgi:serine phosphatase RsbU (regulator of sigma subunit)